jgi:tetratricopeptide (TPR) repeat protein
VGALQTAVVVLAVSTVLLGQSRVRIDRERQAAESARARAQAVNSFLVSDLLGQADPERNPVGTDLSVRQLLDRAANSVADPESSVARDPGVEGAVRSTIGRAYLTLALFPQAAEQLHKAAERLKQAGAPPEDVFYARNRHIWALSMTGIPHMLDNYTRLFNECVAQLGREHPESVYAAEALALTWKGLPQALPLLRENLEIQRRRYGADHHRTLRAITSLVITLGWFSKEDDLAEAESLGREGAERWVRQYGPEFPQTLYALEELGLVLARRGKIEEARSILAPVPDAMVRTLGPDHFQTARTLHIYGQVLEATGDLDGALAHYRRSLASFSKGASGRLDRARFEAAVRAGMARVELAQGRDAEAVRALVPILETLALTLPFSMPTARFAVALSEALADRGEPQAAVELLGALHTQTSGLEVRLDWLRPHLLSLIGGDQLRLAKKDLAAANLRLAVEEMEKSYVKPPAPVLAAARARLTRLDEAKDAAKGQSPPSGR